VPVIPGYVGEDQSDEAFQQAAGHLGFPLLIMPLNWGKGWLPRGERRSRRLAPAICSWSGRCYGRVTSRFRFSATGTAI
jgi:hypothetical protein